MKELKILVLVIGIGIFGLFLVNQINAQGGKGVGISPLTFELTANPGDVIVNQLKVYNPSDSIIGIKMEVEDFTVTGEIGHVKIEPAETETYSIARWVTMEPEEFSLDPREQKFITFTIKVPENAEPGGHYGSILAGTTAVVGEEFVGATVAGRVGALVLLSVSGEVKENLAVKEFHDSGYSEYGPINFTMRFENKGTVHVKPKGYITIVNWLGKKTVDIEIPQRNVLPDSVRKIETSWNKKWIWGGKYTATLSGSYGVSNTPFAPAVITFWVFPWKAGIGILLVIIFFVLTRRRWITAFKILVRGEKIIEK
jgi:hypothetical protein